MDNLVIKDLRSLAPTLPEEPPKELVSLASSLLAKSRSRAGHLKVEEEIARSYACAHIACERLKNRLSLPRIQPRPPCPPKVYAKLFQYFQTVLPVETTTNRQSLPSRTPKSSPATTPVKRATKASANGVSSPHRPSPYKKKPSLPNPEKEPPSWVTPVVRKLCNELQAPAAIPHINAGISSVLAALADAQANGDEVPEINISALIVTLFLYVSGRLAGKGFMGRELQLQAEAALSLMQQLAQDIPEASSISEVDLESHLRNVKTYGWTRLEWFDNVILGGGLNTKGIQVGDTGEDDDMLLSIKRSQLGPVESGISYLQPALGTMMQPDVDYLDEDHERDYEEWKSDIILRIEQMEKEVAQA